jgi:hypothetical protein
MKTLRRMDLRAHWNAQAAADASLTLAAQLPKAAFDSVFPCGPDSRDCLPQPGITNPAQYLDFLNRERPTWRSPIETSRITRHWLRTNQSKLFPVSPAFAGTRFGGTRPVVILVTSTATTLSRYFFYQRYQKRSPLYPNFAAMVSREICSTGVLQKKHTNTA